MPYATFRFQTKMEALKLLIDEECLDIFLVKRELNIACIKSVVAKILGVLILAGSILLKLPQVHFSNCHNINSC